MWLVQSRWHNHVRQTGFRAHRRVQIIFALCRIDWSVWRSLKSQLIKRRFPNELVLWHSFSGRSSAGAVAFVNDRNAKYCMAWAWDVVSFACLSNCMNRKFDHLKRIPRKRWNPLYWLTVKIIKLTPSFKLNIYVSFLQLVTANRFVNDKLEVSSLFYSCPKSNFARSFDCIVDYWISEFLHLIVSKYHFCHSLTPAPRCYLFHAVKIK